MSTEDRVAASADPNDSPENRGGLKKVVAASMAGTVVEWYEFFLFATASTLVFGQLFFVDTGNPLDGILKAFLIYAVGFIARRWAASSSATSVTSTGESTCCRSRS